MPHRLREEAQVDVNDDRECGASDTPSSWRVPPLLDSSDRRLVHFGAQPVHDAHGHNLSARITRVWE
jgi:hypothetical protein